MLRIVRGPRFFICSGELNSPGIKVFAAQKRLGRRTAGGTTWTLFS